MNNVITNANGVKVKVRVYDIGDGQVDRYTIICVSVKIVMGWYIILCSHVAKIHFIHKE